MNPTDNQTPQPVDDELHAITKELFLAGVRQGYQEATYGKSDPAGPEAQKAKARIIQWGTEQQLLGYGRGTVDTLEHVKNWADKTEVSYNDMMSQRLASLKNQGKS